MKKQEKFFEVQNLASKIKEAKGVFVFDFQKLNANQTFELRKKIKEIGGELQVVKNTLFYRALNQSNYALNKAKLDGQSMALFAKEDEISALKALVAFAKSTGLLPLKVGFVEGKIYFTSELNQLASLPPKTVLYGKLVGLLSSPPSQLVRSLNWNLQKLALIINEIKNKKQSGH